MIQRLLIANRGEIALRIIRTCKKMGIETVAIYSEADTESMHTKEATIAIPIGGYTPRESYLIIDKIIDAAKKSNADAIHPGYGFLSENADFSKRVRDEGLIFVGPTPEAILLLGDKTAAKELAKKCGVPVSPGSDGPITTMEELHSIVDQIGLPVMIKAASGGGGKGMRAVHALEDLEQMFYSAQREALTGFNDDRVFVERLIVNPRHIEFQILADAHGNVLSFPERECSIQRRNQKVIEESPSLAVSPETRLQLGAAVRELIKNAGYTNAGTLEFLLDDKGFYFMEVNTRLQVEHPVTEMVTGLDLVEWQIKIANGEALPFSVEEAATPKGHAIECRICAEDVFNNFLPDTGIVTDLQLPSGEHVRNDTGLYIGYEVTVHYDPMVGKLIVWGENRDLAIKKALQALSDYHLVGIKTTIPFCQIILQTEDFKQGHYTTYYVQDNWNNTIPLEIQNKVAVAASFARASLQTRRNPIDSK